MTKCINDFVKFWNSVLHKCLGKFAYINPIYILLISETSLGIKPESADKDGRMTKFLHLISE